jgi:acetate kinase
MGLESRGRGIKKETGTEDRARGGLIAPQGEKSGLSTEAALPALPMNLDRMAILTINTGSSSLKAALYEMGAAETRVLSVRAERLGLPGSRFRVEDARGAPLVDQEIELRDPEAAVRRLTGWLQSQGLDRGLRAIGHRVVHGGRDQAEPEAVTPALLDELRALTQIDPDHMPQAILAVEALGGLYPSLPQVACFDTAFHRHMPWLAQRYPLPRELGDAGIVRFGFHGLSYEYIVQELRSLDAEAADGRLLIAHLGSGASMAAVRGGQSVDTTMGFTPTGGLMMGTRSGDLDPGVMLYLLQDRGMSPPALSELVNRQSGLLGVSGISSDVKELLDRRAADRAAAEALDLFCYQARKFLGALAAVLGGLDTLVFTGGVGEHAAPVRAGICQGLEFLGVQLDDERNTASAPIISSDDSRVTVRVMETNEDLMIARHTYRSVEEGRSTHG